MAATGNEKLYTKKEAALALRLSEITIHRAIKRKKRRILAATSDEEERSSISEAVDFLKTALCDGGRDAKAIETDARQAGINPVTLRRAKKRLDVRSHKVGMPGSHYQKWVWELPAVEGDQTPPEGDQTNGDDRLRSSEDFRGSYGNNLAEDDQVPAFDRLRSEGDAPFELGPRE